MTCDTSSKSCNEIYDSIRKNGFAILPSMIDAPTKDVLIAAIASVVDSEHSLRRHDDNVFGIRHLLDAVPAVRGLAESKAMRALVTPILGENSFPVRGILFDKTPGAN